jgi:hypothetical protein
MQIQVRLLLVLAQKNWNVPRVDSVISLWQKKQKRGGLGGFHLHGIPEMSQLSLIRQHPMCSFEWF